MKVMKKLVLLVAVAISTAVSSQKPPRKVIVETSNAELYVYGLNTIDSVYREHTPCEKIMYLELGLDTSTLEMFWDYEYDSYDTLNYEYYSKERYVFNFRNGVVKYSNGLTREKFKIDGFTYTGPYTYSPDLPPSKGSISLSVMNKEGNDDSYILDFDLNSFKCYLGSEWVSGLADQRRKEYNVSQIIKK
jgi:hypothetical protein